jgi:hypothetical protein
MRNSSGMGWSKKIEELKAITVPTSRHSGGAPCSGPIKTHATLGK